MNILYYCNEYPPSQHGGIGTFTKEIAEHLVSLGHNVVIYGNYDIEEDIIENIKGVLVIRKKKSLNKLSKAFIRIKSYFDLISIIKNYQIELLEVQDAGGLLAFYPTLKSKVVVRLHGSKSCVESLKGIKRQLFYLLEKKHLSKADKIISVSEYTYISTKNMFKINIDRLIHYNGVNNVSVEPELTELNNAKDKTFAFIGSMHKRKGIFDLVDAWIDFSKSNSNVKLLIIGRDVNNNQKEIEKILKLNNVENVCFLGHLSKEDLYVVLKSVHFVFLPTHIENFSLVPIEAMINKKIVFYNDQSSARELIRDGSNGFLIHGKDDILNKLVLAVNIKPDIYRNVASKAYEDVIKNFITDVTLNKDILLYQEVINDGYRF
ncbi:glycosyltransferase family 4 protein [Vibrio parahaemolyticus]|nr:glycosyltransferase family 4 protein [Vibrio parahaemolyticus]